MNSDMRQFTRKDIQLKVLYKSITSFLNDYTANISIGGCFFFTQQPFTMGEQIELILVLPSGRDINATGIVRWVSKNGEFSGVGVQFTLLTEKDQQLIEQLVGDRD